MVPGGSTIASVVPPPVRVHVRLASAGLDGVKVRLTWQPTHSLGGCFERVRRAGQKDTERGKRESGEGERR